MPTNSQVFHVCKWRMTLERPMEALQPTSTHKKRQKTRKVSHNKRWQL